MATQFAPVDLETIEQGKFKIRCQKAFDKLQAAFIEHVQKHEATASATLGIKVSLTYSSKGKSYVIVTGIEAKLPKSPAGVTNAFVSENAEGVRCLFAQAAGSSDGDPKQGRLCDDDGHLIDLDTGQPKETAQQS